MRAATKRCLSVLIAALVVSTAVIGAVNYRGQNAPVQKSEALNPASTATAIVIGGTAASAASMFVDGSVDKSLEKEEMHTELYTFATGTESKSEILSDTFDNYLNDTKAIARMEGKEAYVEYLENNSDATASQAKIKARNAVRDYYAQKQRQVIESWEAETSTAAYIHNVSANSSTAAVEDEMMSAHSWNYDGTYSTTISPGDVLTEGMEFGYTSTSTLVNGDTVTYDTAYFQYAPLKVDTWTNSNGDYNDNTTAVTGGHVQNDYYADMLVHPPSSMSTSPVKLVKQREYVELWTEIESQNKEVVEGTEDFVNGTYDKVAAGELTSEDLVDPYLGAREYDPDTETQSWALRSLTSLGIEPPDDLQNYGEMTVRDETSGVEYTGILMSDGNPPNASGFTIGETYNASAISGGQFVATSDQGDVSLDGAFTLVAAENTDGEAYEDGTQIDYTEDVGYKTSNISEYKQRLEKLEQKIQEIEARKNKQQNSSSGGGAGLPDLPGGFSATEYAIGGLLLLAGAAVWIDQQDDGPDINLRGRY